MIQYLQTLYGVEIGINVWGILPLVAIPSTDMVHEECRLLECDAV
jgi:hypothetical protein